MILKKFEKFENKCENKVYILSNNYDWNETYATSIEETELVMKEFFLEHGFENKTFKLYSVNDYFVRYEDNDGEIWTFHILSHIAKYHRENEIRRKSNEFNL